ncbi:hypothetical protein [Acinetobacter cumulans]|uniref:hypothetical protein n=1 Tax=Acinetobacter cumulans TaxID=2136182 RepID=UPI0014444B91|nr:hypothetical protein [Acinetobacter cumulans]
MNFKIDPKFLYLLEHFSSKEFFYSMRNNYQSFLDRLELLFVVYMRNLPYNYLDFPMPEQVDINWGGTVLPLLRKTMDTLDFAYIRIKEGDLTYLDCASEIRSNDKGMSEFSKKWMDELHHENVKECWDFYTKAKAEAFIIENTYPTYWNQESIVDEISDISKINIPVSYPIYRVNQSIKVKSNEKIAITGLYISEFVPNRVEFMAHSNEDDRGFGSVIPTTIDPETYETYYEKTDWYLIERVANEGGKFTDRS